MLNLNFFRKTALVLLGSIVAASFVNTSFAFEDWHNSKYGEDDQIGAANNLSPKLVKKAAKLVKKGKTYRLGIAVDRKTPAFAPRSLSLTIVQPNQYAGISYGDNKVNYNDDVFYGWLGIGTQIDGLGHAGIDGYYYNGNHTNDFVKADGLTKLGVENIPPIVTRGILLDMAKYNGVDMMTEGQLITPEDIKKAAKQQKVKIKKGDVVIFHTGWLSLLGVDDTRFASGEPGINAGAAEYLSDLGVVAVGADTWAVEAVPSENPARVWEAHQILLAKKGVYILEVLDTRELVADGVNEFMFVLGATMIKGAAQSMINPIAIR